MFAWLTDVFASSGFAVGEAWAFRRNQQWQELRIALATWWLVRAVKAPFLWCSAWLARHGKVGVWSRRVWLAVGLLVCIYFGPDQSSDSPLGRCLGSSAGSPDSV